MEEGVINFIFTQHDKYENGDDQEKGIPSKEYVKRVFNHIKKNKDKFDEKEFFKTLRTNLIHETSGWSKSLNYKGAGTYFVDCLEECLNMQPYSLEEIDIKKVILALTEEGEK